MNNEFFVKLVVKKKEKNSNVFVKYVFYFTREVKNMFILFVASPLMKYKYFPLHLMK